MLLLAGVSAVGPPVGLGRRCRCGRRGGGGGGGGAPSIAMAGGSLAKILAMM